MKFFKYLLLFFVVSIQLNAKFLDKANIILGRPSNNSITINILAKQYIEYVVVYGIQTNNYKDSTEIFSSTFPEPSEIVIQNLKSNTRYFYKIKYRIDSKSNFEYSDEYTFHTQRSPNNSFTFNIQSDSHLYDKKGSDGLMKITMQNQVKDSADFVFDLGDTFGDDHEPFTITDQEIKQLHLNFLPYMSMLCHSTPLFLGLGNHEGESGYYLLQTPPNNLAINASKWRLKYYPNPFPNEFYSGNLEEEGYGIGKPENYYAFEWGDALFVVLDVYRYYTANEKPKGWDWTIGSQQYYWFKNTLEKSKSKYKFVFCHHTLGQGRGAKTTVMLNEWGGWKDNKKTSYQFDEYRPNWGKPIHELMKDNGVNIFFQGHDHLFAIEHIDNIVYQEIPMPSDSTYIIGQRDNSDAYTELTMDGSGYVRVNVSNEKIKVDYVKSYLAKDETDSLKNGMLAYTYFVEKTANAIEVQQDSQISEQLLVYPNPSSEFIEFNISENKFPNEKIKIFNSLGNCILEKEINASSMQRIYIGDFPNGCYCIKFASKSEFFIKN